MSENLPQLFMRKTDMENIPEIILPEGIILHTHIPGHEADWETLIERSFGSHFGFDSSLTSRKGYKPEHVFYLSRGKKELATTSAIEKDEFPGEGWLHMVGVDPDARGMGLSLSIVAAALRSFRERGFNSVMLSTDDFRIPAIKTYLRLGFNPVMSHESHEARWAAIMEKLSSASQSKK